VTLLVSDDCSNYWQLLGRWRKIALDLGATDELDSLGRIAVLHEFRRGNQATNGREVCEKGIQTAHASNGVRNCDRRLSIATKNQPFSQVGWGGCDSLIATISLSD
jgi:hypothetical protein